MVAQVMATAAWIVGGLAGVLATLLAAGFVYERTSEAATLRRNPPPGRMVDIGAGRRLHIRCQGDAPGPTVVFEMGLFEPSAYWWGIQDEVARFARTCSYDRAGVGWSPRSPTSRTMDDRAEDLAALLAAAEVPGPYVLIGHSYGGPLVRLYARDHMDQAAGFVFVDAPDEASIFRPSYIDVTRKTMKPMLRAMALASRLGMLRAWSALRPGAALPEQLGPDARRAVAVAQRPGLYAGAAAEIDSIAEAAGRLADDGFGGPLGDRPVSVITHGTPFPPPFDVLEIGWAESQRILAALSTDSELIVAEKSNHMIHFDEPELVVDAIRRVHAAARDGSQLSAAPAA